MSLLKKKQKETDPNSASEQKAANEQNGAAEQSPPAKPAGRKRMNEFEKTKEKYTRKEKRENIRKIRADRKMLRKDLKIQGMKKYSDFQLFANDMEMEYPEGTLLRLFTHIAAWFSSVGNILLKSATVWRIILLGLLALAITFAVSWISESKGKFTINLTADMMKEGYCLSETGDFAEEKTRLFANEITNANATSVYEINREIYTVDGSHNGPGYMAYTFYLKNNGEEVSNYGYTVNILSSTLDTWKAAWVMFYEGDFDEETQEWNDHQIIYAAAQDDGNPEVLYGYPQAPFIETAYDPDSQYYIQTNSAGVQKYGIETTPYIDSATALQGHVTDFEPGDVKRYTVVCWLEGDDPDCNDSILGGHVSFNVQFERVGQDDTSYFKGLFRTEYNKSYWQAGTDDFDHKNDGDNEAHQPEEDEAEGGEDSAEE